MQSDLTASIQDTIGARCTTEMRFRLGCGSVDWWGGTHVDGHKLKPSLINDLEQGASGVLV